MVVREIASFWGGCLEVAKVLGVVFRRLFCVVARVFWLDC